MQALVGRLEYYLAMERPERQLQTLLPFDWSRGFAIQLNDLQDSDYLAYDPVEGGTGELPDVSTFDRERAAIVRWLDDGSDREMAFVGIRLRRCGSSRWSIGSPSSGRSRRSTGPGPGDPW